MRKKPRYIIGQSANILSTLVVSASILFFSSVSHAAITSDLRIGSKGAQVTELQTILNTQGYLEAQPTGIYGAKTAAAVRAFQKKNGLPQTGTVGPQTKALLNIFASIQAQPKNTEHKKVEAKITLQQQTVAPTAPFTFNPAWKDAVVNLFCTDMNDGGVMSGSGVIIDPRGVILTNAHVAADHIFGEWPAKKLNNCVVRTGSPAYPLYRARIVYMPKQFVAEMVESQYVPEGENATTYGIRDYTLMYITEPISETTKMPAAFPYIPISAQPTLKAGERVYLIGYGANFLGYEALVKALSQIATSSIVTRQAALAKRTTPDALLFNGNLAAQHGSSGGAVIGSDGTVTGLLTFFVSDTGISTNDKVLAAISSEYILNDFKAETGMTMQAYLDGDLARKAQDYLAKVHEYALMFARKWKEKGKLVPGVDFKVVE